MTYVYLIRSIVSPKRRYTGVTADVGRRVREHNEGKLPTTARHRPWRLVTCLAFSNDSKARRFEKYLKTGSGRAFADRHLW